MHTFIFFFLCIGYLWLLIWGLYLNKNHDFLNLTNVLILVILGLIYDNLIIALGRFIGEGNLLESLSFVRFWSHALFTPTLIVFAWSICFKIGLPWAKKTFWKAIVSLMTFGLFFYELVTSIRKLELEANWKNGVLTYVSESQSEIPVMVILVTLVLGVIGFIFWKKYHFTWLFIGTLIMISGGILANWIKDFPIMNVMEFILISTLLMTKQFQVRYQKSHL